MQNEAVRQALLKISAGFKDLAEAVVPADPAGKTDTERQIDLMLEFDRPVGQGLTQQQASDVCKKHGFDPRTVGAWARGDWLVTNKTDGLRYLTDKGREWITDHQGVVPAV